MATVTVRIDGTYENGHEYKRDVEVPAPGDEYAGDLPEWWEDYVWEHTGDGIFGKIGSFHDAKIIRADDPALVGETWEWSG